MIVESDSPTIQTKVKIQKVKREDGKYRYICNLPKNFVERIQKKYKRKKGIFYLDCIKLVADYGKLYLLIDETEELI